MYELSNWPAGRMQPRGCISVTSCVGRANHLGLFDKGHGRLDIIENQKKYVAAYLQIYNMLQECPVKGSLLGMKDLRKYTYKQTIASGVSQKNSFPYLQICLTHLFSHEIFSFIETTNHWRSLRGSFHR